MRFDARAFTSTATAIATGELQGRLEAEQERRQRDLQAYQQALGQFQLGHQLEAESRQRATDPYRLALQYAPQVQPGARGPFISEALSHIGESENQPFAYGPEQFNNLQNAYRGANPNAARFSIPSLPAGSNPWTPVMPPAGAFAAPDQGLAQPPPPGQPAPQAPPAAPVNALPFDTGAAAPLGSVDQQARAAVAAGAPFAPPQRDVTLGQQLGQMTAAQFGGVGFPPPVAPLGTGPGMMQTANQAVFGPLLPAMQTVQARQQGVTQGAAAQGAASGSNPQATQPPNARGQLPDQTPSPAAAAAPATSTAGAPPPPVPPSASVGTAPVTVPAAGGGAPPPNVLHIPGFSRDYPYGEVDQRVQAQAVQRRQTAIARLRDIHAPPETLRQVEDLIGRSPAPDTQAGLQQYDFITQQIEAQGIGQGASIYRAEQAARTAPTQLVTQFLSIIGKSGRANDPAWVRQVALGLGHGELAPLADTLAAGDFGAPEVRKMLQKAIDRIYTPGFGRLDPTTQSSLLEAAKGHAQMLGQKIDLPAAVVLQLTPDQRERLDLERTRVSQAGRAQDIAEGRLRLAEWQTQARINGLLGGAGGGRGGRLTANADLLAARKPYDEALGVYKSLRAQKAYGTAREAYDTAKNTVLAAHPDETPEQEEAAIRHIIADGRTDDKARILANADLRRFRASRAYLDKARDLVAAGAQTTAPAGAGVVVPEFAPSGKRAAAPAGVPAPGQGGGVAMIFTNPTTGEKRRVSADPTQTAQRLLRMHPGWKLPQAQRAVQSMIQEAKHGRSR